MYTFFNGVSSNAYIVFCPFSHATYHSYCLIQLYTMCDSAVVFTGELGLYWVLQYGVRHDAGELPL